VIAAVDDELRAPGELGGLICGITSNGWRGGRMMIQINVPGFLSGLASGGQRRQDLSGSPALPGRQAELGHRLEAASFPRKQPPLVGCAAGRKR
jgi:hypothetical protein